jgi:hypothetical protein
MTTTTENSSDLTKTSPAAPAEKGSGHTTEKYVLGIIILGFAALVIYQVLFCATCYGTSIH